MTRPLIQNRHNHTSLRNFSLSILNRQRNWYLKTHVKRYDFNYNANQYEFFNAIFDQNSEINLTKRCKNSIFFSFLNSIIIIWEFLNIDQQISSWRIKGFRNSFGELKRSELFYQFQMVHRIEVIYFVHKIKFQSFWNVSALLCLACGMQLQTKLFYFQTIYNTKGHYYNMPLTKGRILTGK